MYVVPISASSLGMHATYCLCLSLHVKSIVILFPSNSAWAQVLEVVMYQEIHSTLAVKNSLETKQDRNVMFYTDSDYVHFFR
jgi:hypothetical protein